MEFSNISSLPTRHVEMLERGAPSRWSCGRMFTPNWEKIILFCNSALIVVALAHAYFALKLPFLALALGAYGVGALMLRGKISMPTQEENAQLKADLHAQREHNKLLQEKINKNLSAGEMKDELEEDIRTAEAKLRDVQMHLARYRQERDEARALRDLYREQAKAIKN